MPLEAVCWRRDAKAMCSAAQPPMQRNLWTILPWDDASSEVSGDDEESGRIAMSSTCEAMVSKMDE